jgi:hypothetical protein
VNFFCDENIPQKLARMLNHYDSAHMVCHIYDDKHLSAGMKDLELIKALASRRPRPVLITADFAMGKNPAERKALAESGLTVVFLRKTFLRNLPFNELASKMIRLWPEIIAAVQDCRRPTAFEVSGSGNSVDKFRLTSQL